MARKTSVLQLWGKTLFCDVENFASEVFSFFYIYSIFAQNLRQFLLRNLSNFAHSTHLRFFSRNSHISNAILVCGICAKLFPRRFSIFSRNGFKQNFRVNARKFAQFASKQNICVKNAEFAITLILL